MPFSPRRRCAGAWNRGPGFRGCDRGGARKHAGNLGAASRSWVASKHTTLGTCSALRGRISSLPSQLGRGAGVRIDAKENSSLTAKGAKDGKEQKSLTAKDAKE